MSSPGSADYLPLVLIVEDDAAARRGYAEYLVFTGFRVAEAVDGLDALAKASNLLPDAIVMDLALPRLDGWEATRRLKHDERTKAIPIIAVTGQEGEVRRRTREYGCDGFIAKPFMPEALSLEIRFILTLEEARRAYETADEPTHLER